MRSTHGTVDGYVPADLESAELPLPVFRAELAAIRDRRAHLDLPPVGEVADNGPSPDLGLVGIGLSGGGIRSSTFNLGLLQSLDRAGLLKCVDYLSTVSGGGYVGSCLSAVLSGASREKKKADPFPFPFRHTPGRPESKAFKQLRDYANYLKPSGPFSGLRLPGLVLRGLLINFLILLPLVLGLVVATALVFKNDIRDALHATEFTYAIPANPASTLAAPAGIMDAEFRRVTFDLRSRVQWAPYPDRLDVMASFPNGKVAYLKNQDAANLPGAWRVPVKPGATGCVLTAWPSRNLAYQLGLRFIDDDGGRMTWLHHLIRRLPALFDAQSYHVPDAVLKTADGGGVRIALGDFVGWKQYVVLSGLPRNAYSDSGKFLNGDRWLFDGRSARDLRLTMWLPDTPEDLSIRVRAWDTRDADYLTVQESKRHIDLYAKNGRITAETRSCRDGVSRRVDLGPSPLTGEQAVNTLLRQCSFSWDTNRQDRYLMIRNLPPGFKPPHGQWLLEGDWVFCNREIATVHTALAAVNPAAYSAVHPLRLTAWQSGMDRALHDPVSLLVRGTFRYTKWVVLLFGAMMAFFPLVQKTARITGVSAWRRRDLLTRYLCGGGIAVVAGLAFWELQPLAIYYFFRLKAILAQAGIIGGIDKAAVVLGSITVAAGGVFSSRAIEKGSRSAGRIGLAAMGVIGPGVLWCIYLNLCGWVLNADNIPAMLSGIQGSVVPWFVATAIGLFVVTRVFFNVNLTSMHPFYRDRLSKAFIFSVDDATDRERVVHDDTRKLQTLVTDCAPYHLINATLNITGRSEANLQGRNADFFLFSRDHVGSQTTGYCRTRDFEAKDPHMGLATAMAISGAAAAPNMGRMTNRSFVFIMTLLNIRLGYWARNPRYLNKRWGCRRVGPGYLLLEMMGLVNETSGCLNVSDGGHLENMGLYELVRRRCRFIIIGDAEADKGMTFKGLADAIRMIRIDMGISIDIDLDDIHHPNGGGKHHFALGTIRYSDGVDGQLLYIKSSVSDRHNPYVEDYMARHPDFPHESTADQFFDEAQFEAYRALGADVGETVLAAEAVESFVDAIVSNSGAPSSDSATGRKDTAHGEQ